MHELDLNNYISIDLETKGLIEKGVIPLIVCYSWCDANGSGAREWIYEDPEHQQEFEELIEDKIPVFHNAKFDIPILEHHGVMIPKYHDTMLMSYVLDTSQKHSLKACGEFLGVNKGEYDFKTKGYEFTEELAAYAKQDAIVTWKVFKNFYPQIILDIDLGSVYGLELTFLECIIEYEATGIPVDVEATKEFEQELVGIIWENNEAIKKKWERIPAKGLKTYKKEHPELAQFFHSNPRSREWNYQLLENFNYNSRHHIAYILQQEGWRPTNYGKDGIPTLGEGVLSKIAHQFPSAQSILTITKASKTLNTFIKALLQNRDENDFVHTSVNQTVTRTGRLSSSKPNLQNLPSRGETGDKIRALIKAPKGYILIGVDLSNIEARILAFYLEKICHDSYLANVFRSGVDLHDTNAVSWGMPRDLAKKVLYLTLYGGGAEKLASEANLSLLESEIIFNKFNNALPSVNKLRECCHKYVRRNGYVRTILKRHVHYPLINSKNKTKRGKAERQSFNAQLQGSAADIIKSLSVATFPSHAKYAVQAMLQNHDENLWLAPDVGLAEKFITEVKPIWNSSQLLGTIPIVAEFKTGDTWYEIH